MRSIESRYADMERGTRGGRASDGKKTGYTSGRVCPSCCSRRCAAEYPGVPSRSVWFGTRNETFLTDVLIPLVGRPGELWCNVCEKFTSDVPSWLPGQPVGLAVCSKCNESCGCNECWPDVGSFCETCNVFECHRCQRGWYNGDAGIFCSAHRGGLANTFHDGLFGDDFYDDDEDDY